MLIQKTLVEHFFSVVVQNRRSVWPKTVTAPIFVIDRDPRAGRKVEVFHGKMRCVLFTFFTHLIPSNAHLIPAETLGERQLNAHEMALDGIR